MTSELLPEDEILFGAAYYPEYLPSERMPVDLDLMVQAGVTVIRVGESVWSTWEPSDGVFDLEWLRPTLDAAAERGIRVVLGTPTYAVPPWLQRAHPEIAAEDATGHRVPWGGRQEVDFTHPVFRTYAERVIRRVVSTYADHPAVIGFQLDNEPGIHLMHNDHVFERFVAELAEQYGDVENLNEQWGLVYWSHRLTSYDELWRPDGNTLPQYDLAWRRFQARLTTEYLSWQADIVRGYAHPEQFVTTCIAYSRPGVDDTALAEPFDVNAANLYYGMQDHLALGEELDQIAPWTTTGVWGLLHAADRAFATKQDRFLVTETNAQAIGSSSQNYPPYPGQLTQAALALVARGARMIEYWHWNTLPYGTETFWGGVLPHSGIPGRVYEEVSELGALLRELGPRLSGYRPDSDIALLVSNRSRWAFDFFPPVPDAPSPEHGGAYGVIFGRHYRALVEAGAQVRLIGDEQLAGADPEALAQQHPVLVAPALYAASDALLDLLGAYAEAGGHLVIGMRTGYGDDEARARVDRAPGRLWERAGAWYEEFTNLRRPVDLTAGSLPARGTLWADGLLVDGAEVVAGYADAALDRFAAITTREVASGRITVLGTVPDAGTGRLLADLLAPRRLSTAWGALPDGVLVSSGTTAGGERAWFVHNWSAEPAAIDVPDGLVALDGSAPAGLVLEPWSVEVLFETAPVA